MVSGDGQGRFQFKLRDWGSSRMVSGDGQGKFQFKLRHWGSSRMVSGDSGAGGSSRMVSGDSGTGGRVEWSVEMDRADSSSRALKGGIRPTPSRFTPETSFLCLLLGVGSRAGVTFWLTFCWVSFLWGPGVD